MTVTVQLDLKGVISPLNLLKCKSRLKDMQAGDVLEVWVADMDVVTDLCTIVERSADNIIYHRENEGVVCLGIEKGEPSFEKKEIE